jgi:CRISPR-associated protein Csm2
MQTIIDNSLKNFIVNIVNKKKEADGLNKEITKLNEEIKKLKKEFNKVEKNKNIKNKNEIFKKNEELNGLKENVKKIVEEEIPNIYKNLMNLLNQKLDNIKLSELNEEEFIQPEGLCEAISIGLQFKRTQLRKFFSEIKNIKADLQKANPDDTNRNIGVRLIAIIPKLAYSQGRGLIDEEFYVFMKKLIQNLRNELNKENFKKFDQIFEAIIAYHRYYNPKEE